MMIQEAKYMEVLDSGLILDHYFILCYIKNKQKIPKNKRIQGFINLLEKKEYLSEGALTEKGFDLIGEFELSITGGDETPEKVDDFATWVQGLHKRCQDKLVELTGNKQVTDKVDKKAYSFLPNTVDLSKVLYKVVTLYKIKDYDRIEKCIMSYIERCHSSKNWFPILQYYIMKNNSSRLVTDCESSEEETQAPKTQQKFI